MALRVAPLGVLFLYILEAGYQRLTLKDKIELFNCAIMHEMIQIKSLSVCHSSIKCIHNLVYVTL